VTSLRPLALGSTFAVLLAAFACSSSSSSDNAGSAGGTAVDAGGAGGPGDAGADADDDAPSDANPDAIVVPALDPTPCLTVDPAGPAFSASYAFPAATPLEAKDSALFVLLASDPGTVAAIAASPALATLGAARDKALRDAAKTCAGDADCIAKAVLPSAADIDADAAALVAALGATDRLAWLAVEQMRPSGRFHRYFALSDADLVTTAYRAAASALASGFDSYVRELAVDKRADVLTGVVAAHPESLPFFRPLALVTLAGMLADGRDEAARYEPLDTGENAGARALIATTDFTAYPYTVILVPGEGPGKLGIPLDPAGQKRCDLAAARFAAKLAPFILTSGGHVHPDRTPYSEAIEMKKYLVATYAIPPERIIVDPHARHTTTNLRNASRLALRYGVPDARPMLVTSDPLQSAYIGIWKGDFGPRCEKELGYRPWRALVPMSANDSCMIPTTTSLHVAPSDLLDP
jgi:hypothetical protein